MPKVSGHSLNDSRFPETQPGEWVRSALGGPACSVIGGIPGRARQRSSTDRCSGGAGEEITVPWTAKKKDAQSAVESNAPSNDLRNEGLIQAIVRAHAWLHALQNETYDSVEQLADAQPSTLSLATVPKLLPLSWNERRHLLI